MSCYRYSCRESGACCLIFIALYLLRRLRGTVPGAYNRLDLLSLVTCGVDENDIASGTEDVMLEGWQDDETHNPDIPAISHRRGMQPFVFVPFEEVIDLITMTKSLSKLIIFFRYCLVLCWLEVDKSIHLQSPKDFASKLRVNSFMPSAGRHVGSESSC